jgi:hypothetical protein
MEAPMTTYPAPKLLSDCNLVELGFARKELTAAETYPAQTLLSDNDFVELGFPRRQPKAAEAALEQVLQTSWLQALYSAFDAVGLAMRLPITVDPLMNPSATVGWTTDFLPRTEQQQIYDAFRDLYLTSNSERDRLIAKRLATLYADAIDEQQHVVPESFSQFAMFFLKYPDVARPKIMLTPDGTVSAHWIHGPDDFVAIEFTGKTLAKIMAEVPRENGVTSKHFNSELPERIPSLAAAIGASLT